MDSLNSAMGKQGNTIKLPTSFRINNCDIKDNKRLADAFNAFFADIGQSTSENVPRSNLSSSDYLPAHHPNSIFVEPVQLSDVQKIVQNLKPKSSSGYDEISTIMLKLTISEVAVPITHIINRSLDTGVFPDNLKLAKVIPVYKNSDPSLLNNYRPISLLPAFSKLFEKVMYKKVNNFLESNNLLYKHQYGFRSKHSTIHPVLHLLNQCAEANNKVSK